jgi:iron complex outermembrane receptor protein
MFSGRFFVMHRLLLASAALAALLPSVSFAQSRPPLETITVTGERRADAPTSVSVLTFERMIELDRPTVARALDLLPGVNVNPGARGGARNERGAFVRGFDLLRVPVLLDGIPVSIPYEGEYDLGRFTTFDLASIEVAKSYASVLYGPNALGGAINLVTRTPTQALEADASATFDADRALDAQGWRLAARFGGATERWFWQVSGSRFDQSHTRLPKDFRAGLFENGGRRNQSSFEDSKLSARLGFRPGEGHEYVVAYTWQDATKQAPTYAGNIASEAIFFTWPFWKKQSLYLLGDSQLAEGLTLRTRLYRDTFKNQLKRFDDASYSRQTRPFAFTSDYDDEAIGGSATLTLARERYTGSLAAFGRRDIHREQSLTSPHLRFEDDTWSIATEHAFQATDQIGLRVGASWDKRDARQAQDFQAGRIVPVALADADTFNWQAGVTFDPSEPLRLYASIARKSRFATQRERFSYGLGRSVPNPALEAERGLNLETGAVWTVSDAVRLEGALFRSHLDDAIQDVTVGRQTMPPFGPLTQRRNVGEARTTGAEFSLNARPIERVVLDISYTWLDRISTARPKPRLFGTPRHKLFGSATYRPVDRLQLTAALQWESKRSTSDVGDGEPVGAFLLGSLRAAFALTDRLSLEAGVNNLFDTLYEYDRGFPESGRSYFFGLRASL